MCGILCYTGKQITKELFLARVDKLTHRGRDFTGISGVYDDFFLGHTLHAVVNCVPQPIDNCFVANCEIYNWGELAKKYNILAKNDAGLLYCLLQKKGIAALKEIDGDYAFVWKNKERIYAARDIIGVKPVWWHKDGTNLWIASENKALDGKGELLDPRKILVYEEKKINFVERPFVLPPEINPSYERAAEKVGQLLSHAVKKRLLGLSRAAILFSGGVDSTLLAVLAKKYCRGVFLYTAGLQGSEDVLWAEKVAKMLGLPQKTYVCKTEEIEQGIREVMRIIESNDVMKVGVGLPFHFACKRAHADGHKVILSGLGSEELFAGYKRHKEAANVNEECFNGLISMHERDLYRDDTITMAHQLELRVPFLDDALRDYALSLPTEYKIKDGQDKAILRDAALLLGVPKEVAFRKKRAAQYGSGMDKAIEKLAKKSGYKTKKGYLSYIWEKNIKTTQESPLFIRQ